MVDVGEVLVLYHCRVAHQVLRFPVTSGDSADTFVGVGEVF